MNSEEKKQFVYHVNTDNEFDEIIQRAAEVNKIVFIKFGATWCGPCKRIHPCYEALANSLQNCIFLSVDVDTVKVGERYGISALPTFLVFKNKQFTLLMKGANEPRLINLVNNQVSVP